MAKEKIPLPALLKPVLSQQSISYLTQGTIYAKDNIADASKVESTIQVSSPSTNVTDFVLTKVILLCFQIVFYISYLCQIM